MSEIENLNLSGAIFGHDLGEGRMRLRVDKRALNLIGQASVAGNPATVAWQENFTDDAPFRSRYDVHALIDDVARLKDFGIDLTDLPGGTLKGGFTAELHHTVAMDKTAALVVRLDATSVSADFPAFGWRKAPGIGGTVELEAQVDAKDRIASVPRFSVVGGGLVAHGGVNFNEGGDGVEKVWLDRLSFGRNDVKGTMARRHDGVWRASMRGPELDLAPFLKVRKKAPPEPEAPPAEGGAQIDMAVDLDRIWLAQDRKIERVAGSLAWRKNKWRSADLKGLVGADKLLEVQIRPVGDTGRTLHLSSEDAGATFRTLDMFDNMNGGSLRIVGSFDDTKPTQPLGGRALVEDYRIAKAPMLAHVLSLLALTGIVESMEGEGLSFRELKLPFVLDGATLEIHDAKAWGPSLGFTAKGTIDSAEETVNLEGTVVPAYAINAIFGSIPVLGEVFTGGEEGSGVFAATYTMTGPAEDPDVTVNPLAALAPGFLRNLFDIFDDEKKDAKESTETGGNKSPQDKPAPPPPTTPAKPEPRDAKTSTLPPSPPRVVLPETRRAETPTRPFQLQPGHSD